MSTTIRQYDRVEIFSIPALDCAEEMVLIEKGLERQPGIGALDPLYLERRLRVSYDSRQTDARRIAAAISDLGFPAQVASAVPELPPPRRPLRWWTTMGGGIVLSAAGSASLAASFLPATDAITAGTARALNLVAAALCVVSTVVAGAPVARAAWRAARLHAADMNLLMTIAAVGALATGYFFEASTAMFLFGVSLLLESYSLERTRRAVRGLLAIAPSVACRFENGQFRDVTPQALRVGDLVLVKPGQRVPVDGVVLEGNSHVNEAPITGESQPVEKGPAARLFAGSLNGEGSLQMEAVHTAADSTLARIAGLVAEAEASRAPTARFVDEFARRYTPAVIALAAIFAVGPPVLAHFGIPWAGAESPAEWFRRALVLLVIACPCALVISTPVTIVCGLYHATRRGLLVKGGQHLENAARVDCVAFDKTGTLTSGRAEVVHIELSAGTTAEEVLRVAASLEHLSEHPLAAAIVRAARRREIVLGSVTGFAARRGFGVEGQFDGERWYVGSAQMFSELLPLAKIRHVAGHDASTAVLVGNAQAWLGTIYLADPLRPGAAEAIARLRRVGVKTIVVLTGDRRSVAEEIGRQIGADRVEAELLPEDKVAHVRRLAEQYPHLAVVGDGVNDAPALAAAGVGIALGNDSSDLALETADVVIMSSHLERVAELVKLGRRVRRLLRQNIGLALGIKAMVILLAAAGPITMWMAVAADVGASLLVISNGMRLIRINASDAV